MCVHTQYKCYFVYLHACIVSSLSFSKHISNNYNIKSDHSLTCLAFKDFVLTLYPQTARLRTSIFCEIFCYHAINKYVFCILVFINKLEEVSWKFISVQVQVVNVNEETVSQDIRILQIIFKRWSFFSRSSCSIKTSCFIMNMYSWFKPNNEVAKLLGKVINQ